MAPKTVTLNWQEGAGDDPSTDPAIDVNGQRRIVVPVASGSWVGYVPNNDAAAAKAVIDVQASMGVPT